MLRRVIGPALFGEEPKSTDVDDKENPVELHERALRAVVAATRMAPSAEVSVLLAAASHLFFKVFASSSNPPFLLSGSTFGFKGKGTSPNLVLDGTCLCEARAEWIIPQVTDRFAKFAEFVYVSALATVCQHKQLVLGKVYATREFPKDLADLLVPPPQTIASLAGTSASAVDKDAPAEGTSSAAARTPLQDRYAETMQALFKAKSELGFPELTDDVIGRLKLPVDDGAPKAQKTRKSSTTGAAKDAASLFDDHEKRALADVADDDVRAVYSKDRLRGASKQLAQLVDASAKHLKDANKKAPMTYLLAKSARDVLASMNDLFSVFRNNNVAIGKGRSVENLKVADAAAFLEQALKAYEDPNSGAGGANANAQEQAPSEKEGEDESASQGADSERSSKRRRTSSQKP